MLTSTILLSSLLPLALSSPITPRDDVYTPPVVFGVIAARSASPIHFQAVNASGQAFWIGKNSATYCPDIPQFECPPDPGTVFAAGGEGASLDTVVPGGQQVYVAPTGALSYTRPHSGYIPPGSAVGTFNATLTQSGGPIGFFTFEGLGATGWLACPVTKNGPYQVFADIKGLKDKDVPGHHKDKCLGFSMITSPFTGQAAWEYS